MVMATVAAPLTVLVARLLAVWGLPTRMPAWTQVCFLVVVPVSIVSTMIWSARQARREEAAAAIPAGRCGRCAAELFSDDTGRRYYSREDGYLCPPQYRVPGNRRHQVLLRQGNSGPR
jgi:hypothetical protein